MRSRERGLVAAAVLCAALAGRASGASPCDAGLRASCRAAGWSRLVARHPRNAVEARLSWEWLDGGPTGLADLGEPTGGTAYALCVYAGTSTSAVAVAEIPASKTSWTADGSRGFRYRDATTGVRTAVLKAGRAGTAKAILRGSGAALPRPAGPLALPVTVQLVSSTTDLCLEAVYGTATVKRNDADGFRAAPQDRWVGTWSASPLCYQAATLLGLPRTLRFADQSVRMIVHTSVAGELVRVRLTNQCGTGPLRIGAATVGIREAGAGIRADTLRSLAFSGDASVVVPAGSTVTSDPVPLGLPALTDLVITLYLPDATVPTTSHPQAATGYLSAAGDFTHSTDAASFPTRLRQWVFLDAVDVLASREAGAVVAFGDSIIDGAGSTYDANTRWPDFLARRLVAANEPLGVLNQGINGNKVLNSLLGDSALVRFDRDVLGQSGVRDVILLEGINDIGLGSPDVSADQVIAGYRELIARAHAAGLRIFGGTLTPAKDNPYPFYAPYDETKRVAINRFIREGGAFDAVLDFAAAVSDPADPAHWRPGLSGDALHPSDAGAEAIANAIDLSLFRARATRGR